MASEDDFALAYWKVLELSFDCTPLPYLIQEHHYGGTEEAGPSIIPETDVEETARAVRELLAAGVVRVADETHTLTPAQVEAVLSDSRSWDARSGAFSIEVVNVDPKAVDLLRERPREADPHRTPR